MSPKYSSPSPVPRAKLSNSHPLWALISGFRASGPKIMFIFTNWFDEPLTSITQTWPLSIPALAEFDLFALTTQPTAQRNKAVFHTGPSVTEFLLTKPPNHSRSSQTGSLSFSSLNSRPTSWWPEGVFERHEFYKQMFQQNFGDTIRRLFVLLFFFSLSWVFKTNDLVLPSFRSVWLAKSRSIDGREIIFSDYFAAFGLGAK